MSEETDALNNRIRQLENQVADMQRLVQDTSDLLDIARANGLDKFLTGHGFWQSQAGTLYFDPNGMTIVTPTADATVDVVWRSAYNRSHVASGDNYNIIHGYNDGVDALLGMFTYLEAGNTYANMNLTASVGAPQAATNVHGDVYVASLQVYTDNSNSYVRVTGQRVDTTAGPVQLQLDQGTSDPVTTARGGALMYRTDTNKARLYDTTWDNLATESYVASGAGVATGFADHFLVMGG